MRKLKKISLGLLLFLVISAIGGYIYFKSAFKPASSQLTIRAENASFPFLWESDTINRVLNPYAAMLLPVSLKGCPETYFMQFDLGAPSSLFYKNKLEAINNRYHNLVLQQQDGESELVNFQFTIGRTLVDAKKIAARQFDSSEIDWTDTTTRNIIGTIGTDFFEDKVLVIDYPKKQLYVGDKIPANLAAGAELADFKFESRRVLLPAVINNKTVDIFFDSGTSAFELMTDKRTWESLAKKGATVDRYPVRSWDNQLMVNTVATDCSIRFHLFDTPLRQVTYVEGTSFLQRMLMQFGGVGGLTGNKLFINKIVLLDTKNKKFGVFD
ncbi:hypothetical protein HRG84_07190 [Flavisolibacter sp. BT320]|nr:hypothetical protein [Flavisolibacter longurius]